MFPEFRDRNQSYSVFHLFIFYNINRTPLVGTLGKKHEKISNYLFDKLPSLFGPRKKSFQFNIQTSFLSLHDNTVGNVKFCCLLLLDWTKTPSRNSTKIPL